MSVSCGKCDVMYHFPRSGVGTLPRTRQPEGRPGKVTSLRQYMHAVDMNREGEKEKEKIKIKINNAGESGSCC
jgi:hypothetical protein